MKTKAFDFKMLGEALLVSTQGFIDTYATKFPNDGPILAFCLYFDSQIEARGMVYPLRAKKEKKDSHITDVASWYYYGEHIDAYHDEKTTAFYELYDEFFSDEDRDEEDQEQVVQGFHDMVRFVINRLNFEKLPKTDDFIYFADGMDEEYEHFAETIPKPLLKKHFGMTS